MADQRAVEVHPDELDPGSEDTGGGEPADDMADPAPHVDEPHRLRSVLREQRTQPGPHRVGHSTWQLELLAEPLQLAVGPQQQRVDRSPVEK